MDPRVVFVDYRDNFGNFSSCFSLERQANLSVKPEALWGGGVEVTEQDQLPLSNFHQQLIDFEQNHFGAEESKEPEPEQIDYQAAKQAGQSTR